MLEDADDRPVELIEVILDPGECRKHDSHVPVVTTGVHLSRDFRGEGQKAALMNGQGVAAAAKGDGAPASIVRRTIRCTSASEPWH